MNSSSDDYTPGVCNIGRAEVRLRWALGWGGVLALIGLWAALVYIDAPSLWRLTLFIPAFLSAMGFLQAKQRFCAKYGLQGAINFGAKAGQTEQVQDSESRRRDRKKSLTIVGFAAVIGVIVAFAAWWLPFKI